MKKITILLLSVLAAFQLSFAQPDYRLDTLYVNTTIAGNTGNNMRDMSYHGNKLVMLDKGNQKLCFFNALTGTFQQDAVVTSGTGYSVCYSNSGTPIYTVGAYGMTGRMELWAYDGTNASNVANTGAGNGTLNVLSTSRMDFISLYGDIESTGGYAAAATVNNIDAIVVWPVVNGAATNLQAPYVFKNNRSSVASGADIEFVNDNKMWVSGSTLKPVLCNLNYTDTTATVATLNATAAAPVGGMGYFALNGKEYVVVPTSALGAFDIYDVTDGAATAELVLSQTQNLGSTSNGSAHISAQTSVSNDTAYIYFFVPNNGLVGYRFYDASSAASQFETSIDTVSVYSTGFESAEGFTVGTQYNQPLADNGPEGNKWDFYYGTPSSTNKISGAASAQMRWYTANPLNFGYMVTNFETDSVDFVTFKALTTGNHYMSVQYSTDGGTTFLGDSVYELTSSAMMYTYQLPQANMENLRFKFSLVKHSTTSSKGIVIDDVVFYKVVENTQVLAPVITPESGAISEPTLVTMSCGTTGATIYYTLDGTTPTDTSLVYSAPFTVSAANVTIKAIAMYDGALASEVSEVSYTYVPPTVAVAPVMTPEGGNYTEPLYIKMSSETVGARIYYTLDGTTPDTLTATLFADSVLIHNTTTVKAVAVADGLDISEVTTEVYTLPVVFYAENIAAFYAAVEADSTNQIVSFKFVNSVSVAYQSGQNLYVTDATGWLLIYGNQDSTYVNGDVLNGFSGKMSVYQGVPQIINSVLPTAVTGAAVLPVVKTLGEISLADANMFVEVSNVDYITTASYTTSSITQGNVSDGVDTFAVRNNFKLALGSYAIGNRVIIKGFVNIFKGVAQLYPIEITLVQTQVATPVITPVGGSISAATSVSITCATEGAAIFYTTDGTTPDTLTATRYTVPFTVSSTTTVKAVATLAGLEMSEMATEVYTYDVSTVATPVITPESGAYTDPTQVVITCSTDGATIYYTLDGTTPDATSTVYSDTLTVTETTVVKAIAMKEGMETSAVAEATYTFPTITDVEDIAGFYAAGKAGLDSAEYRITGPVNVVYQNYRSLYVQDASGWLLIFGDFAGATYNNGDVLQGVTGKYITYQGYGEMIDFVLPTAEAGIQVLPVAKQISEIVADDIYSYVSISGVQFTANVTYTTTSTTNGTASQDGDEIVIRNSFRVIDATFTPTDVVDIVGFVSVFSGEPQIYPTQISAAVGVGEAQMLSIYVQDGNVYVPAQLGDMIEVYTVTGQRLLQVVADASVMVLNQLPSDQILMVRVAGQTAKVVVK